MVEPLLWSLFYILVFPGFLFLAAGGLVVEYVDRKLYARFQNRMGPPFLQPLADFIKLVAKEDLIPESADKLMFKAVPLVALAAATASFFYVPLWGAKALFSFEGDAVIVLYLLTIPTLCFFLGGWFSTSLFATFGAVRTLTQLFAYEVPLFMAILSPAVLAGSWSLSGIAAYYQLHPLHALLNLPGFAVAIVALLGKLEKVPFDIPEAETEIVGGTFTEYSGRLLAFFRLTIDVEAVVTASLVAAVFLPWGMDLHPAAVLGLYLVKVGVVVFLLALARSIFARLRIEQMVEFCWKWLAPAALAQILISVVASGVLR
ncbi:MAG: NADH-quinone oxidoreductase subunit H [Deltaproteobacteria bacterium]|nr:NADH-quinone oxidoreductase subunit H [Deltaproteobacteria bacterium]